MFFYSPLKWEYCMKNLFKLLAMALFFAALSTMAFAGAKTGDITVDSEVGTATNIGVGTNVEAETNVHSVDIKDGAKTGDVTITGKAGRVTNIAAGHNVKAETNVGSVK